MAKKTKGRTYMRENVRENGVDRRISFLIPALRWSLALLILKNFLRKLKGHGRTLEKTEWIRRICFFIASLVLPVALDIPKRKKML